MSQGFFMGEMMTCAICGLQQKSDPQVESGWTVVELDQVPYYVCPKHLQPDRKGYEAAWTKTLKRLIALHRAGHAYRAH